MSKTFSVTILGSNSALPTSERYPTAQVLNASERFFLIDCGEGTQMQLRKYKVNFMRINHIFISHLHGDHCFGLIGLISTLGLLGRTSDLYIFSVAGLEEILRPQMDFFCRDLPYQIKFVVLDSTKSEVIYSDKTIEVESIPLVHRVPTCGFLFREKAGDLKLKKSFVFQFNPGIKEMLAIKKGADYETEDGRIIPNKEITETPVKARSYAFCSDTKYVPENTAQLKNVDVLYHEATFTQDKEHLAEKTCHSTAQQAALIAKKSDVKELFIGHFSSRYKSLTPLIEEACTVFENTSLAIEGTVIEIK